MHTTVVPVLQNFVDLILNPVVQKPSNFERARCLLLYDLK